MYFGFSEDQLLLQNTLRDFLSKECTPEQIRALWATETGRSPELWKQLADLGVTGLLVPEDHQGMGLGDTDLVLILEEAGRAALAEPLISTTAVGVPLILESGKQELVESWLKRIAVGDAIVAVGHSCNAFVSDAHVADLLLLPHGDELHALAPGDVQRTHQPANDPARRIFEVSFSTSDATCIARGTEAQQLLASALSRGALACAAQQLGVAEQLIEMAVAYAAQRKQFGQPIGAFQAIKHMLADVKVKLEYARPLVYRAAHSLATRSQHQGLHTSMAKLAADDAAKRAARTALQVHGAIGYTWEQDLHLWMRRAWSLALAWGDQAFHEARVSQAILMDGAPVGPGQTFTD